MYLLATAVTLAREQDRPGRQILHPFALPSHSSHPGRPADLVHGKSLRPPSTSLYPPFPPVPFVVLAPLILLRKISSVQKPLSFFFLSPSPFSHPPTPPGVSRAANLTHSLSLALLFFSFLILVDGITGALETYSPQRHQRPTVRHNRGLLAKSCRSLNLSTTSASPLRPIPGTSCRFPLVSSVMTTIRFVHSSRSAQS